MTDITTMLDTLADYQAQRDLLEMNKRELLDTVKVPDEVKLIQFDANQRKSELDSHYNAVQEMLSDEKRAALAAVVVPPEVQEIYRQITAQRQQIEAEYARKQTEEWDAISAAKLKIEAEFSSRVDGVFASLNQRKAEITAEFGEKASAVDANIAKLKAEIVAATTAEGHSVKGKVFHAVYVPGRITWNTDKLDGMAEIFPQLKTARKVGDPSVTIRPIQTK